MAGRGEPRVSLFPFMSILACTIGALTLLLAAMSISAVGDTGAATRAYRETRAIVDTDRANFAIEEERLEEAEALWAKVDEALSARGLSPGLSLSSIESELGRIRHQSELIQVLEELEAEHRRVESEKKSIETTISVLESRRETLPILIDSTGLSRHVRPYFVECDAAGVTAYSVREDIRYFVSNEDLSANGNFGRYLRRVRATPGALLVLLVRPDGLATSRRAEEIARSIVSRVARLPLPGKGELDWSLLRRAEGGEG